MVPSLIVHCIKEVESRGLTEVGIYRIPGSDKEVKGLKVKTKKNQCYLASKFSMLKKFSEFY